MEFICKSRRSRPARSKAHKHEGQETALYVLSGESGCWYGDKLERHLVAGAGDFIYIPAGMPHLPYNLSDTETCVAVIARTDPNEQESVVLLPEFDGAHGDGKHGMSLASCIERRFASQ